MRDSLTGGTPQDKRQLILESAFQIFTQKGYEQTKMDLVAKRAGVGKGTIYLYFPNKESLLREMVKEMTKKYLSIIKEMIREAEREDGGDALVKLRAVYRGHAYILAKRPSLAKLHLYDFPFVDQDLNEWLEQEQHAFIRMLADIVKEGILQKVLRPIDPHLAALLLLSGLGAILPYDGGRVPDGEEILELLLHGLMQPAKA